MIKIQSLLNPPTNPELLPPFSSLTPPATPSYTRQTATPTPASLPRKRMAPSLYAPRQKIPKDAPVFTRNPPKEPVMHAPFECTERDTCLTSAEVQELRQQHERFTIFPAGGSDGLIADFPRHIPYKSDKRSFLGQTGRDAFEVFQYTFSVPGSEQKYTVMWDYQIGLVRITPFFKARNFPKTQPNKVINMNNGLRELSHSITGGAIAAQGYWMPYGCARAICATFCWKIRWALTPVFGPSFLRDCLPPQHAEYEKFKISRETIRVCTLEAEGWKLPYASRMDTLERSPFSAEVDSPGPRSAVTSAPRQLRQRAAKTRVRNDTPFDSDTSSSPVPAYADDSDEDSDNDNETYPSSMDSPAVSPCTTTPTRWSPVNVNDQHGPPPPPSSPMTDVSMRTPPPGSRKKDLDTLSNLNAFYSTPTSTPLADRYTQRSKRPGGNKTKEYPFPPASNVATDTSDNASDEPISTPSPHRRGSELSSAPPKKKKQRFHGPKDKKSHKYRAREYHAATALLQMANSSGASRQQKNPSTPGIERWRAA